jgi:hypothetical protein
VTILHFLSKADIDYKTDTRGDIGIFEIPKKEYFHIKRIYYITKVPRNKYRGSHAHKSLHQVFFSLSGSFKLEVTDGVLRDEVQLIESGSGYYLPAGYWRELSDFTDGAVCLVLASDHYDVDDYIYDYEEFREWRKSHAKN